MGSRSAAITAALLVLASAAARAGDGSTAGETLFENRCARCHGLAGDGAEGLAPALPGIVGRTIATRPGYYYTDAMKAVHGAWTPEALDRYLADPQGFAPGSEMDVASPDPAERQAIIAYLATLR